MAAPGHLISAARMRREQMGKRGLRRRAPVTQYPREIERRYRRLLVGYVSEIRRLVDQNVISILDVLAQEANALRPDGDGYRADRTWARQVQEAMAATRIGLTRLEPTDTDVMDIGNSISDHSRAQFKRQIRAVLGVDVLAQEAWLADELASFAAENVALIRSIRDQSLDQIEGLVQRGLRSGTRPSEIAGQIRERYGVTERRAQLIARDQTSKLNGQLTELRQKSIGVTRYIWSTSQDERVRPDHAERDGKEFAWSDPPDDGHPGQPINCRCVALPVLDEILDEVEP